MPDTLKEYYAKLNKIKTKTPAQNALLRAIKAVNEAGDKLRKPDRYKRVPYLHAEDRDKLMELHKKVAVAAEAIVKDQTESRAVRELVTKFSALASANYTRLGAYEPDQQPKTLDAIEEETRTMYLDHSEAELAGKKGGAISSRIPVSFLDNKGKRINGLFTPKREKNVFQTLSDKFNEYAEQCDSELGKQLVSGLMAKLEQKGPELLKKYTMKSFYPDDRSKALGYLFIYGANAKNAYQIDSNELAQVIKDVFPEETRNMKIPEVVNAIGAEALSNMVTLMEPLVNEVRVEMEEAGLADGSRVDSRNAAMSAVADLLHMPNVIARSRPMVLRDKNGNEIQGTFIAEAEGEDLNNLSPKAANIDENALEDTDGKAFKDIADLQVLDFICGNVDRHYQNMFYKLEGGKVVGVQGIDNDCSFGTFVPEAGESQKRLTGLDNMRAVSESTYERVMALNGDALKYALRGYGLSEAQLDAAAKRLDLLQKALTKGVEKFQEIDEKNGEDLIKGEDAREYDEFSFSYDENDQKDAELKQKEEVRKAEAKAKNAAHAAKRLDKEGKPLPEIKVPGGDGSLSMKKGYIRVVPDNQFYRLEKEDLLVMQNVLTGAEAESNLNSRYTAEGNTFRAAYGGVANMKLDYRKQRRAKLVFPAAVVGQKNRDNWKNLPDYRRQAEAFVNTLNDNTRTFHSNGKYRDMESAAKDYLKVLRRIEVRTEIANRRENISSANYKMDVQAVVSPKDLQDMQKAAEKLNKAATNYLKYKLGPNMDKTTDGMTEYSKGRVECAQSLLQATNDLKVIKGQELNTAQTNEREAKENLARRIGDKAEAKDYRNKEKPAQQPVLQ